MSRKRNDATLSKLGDIYQYFIALMDCFKMEAGDKIQIEVQGDVTLISSDKKSFQKEVKHHTGSSSLSDRDTDLWNTLKNWVIDYSDSMKFNQLILFTTSDIAPTSVFHDWNSKEKADKYNVLYEIGRKVKNAEEIFRPCYNNIFNESNATKEQLCDLLDKFRIEHLQPQIQGISARFSPYLVTIPEENRDNYIASLLGIVLKQIIDPPHIWEVTFEIFQKHAQTIAPSFMKEGTVPLPLDFLTVEPDSTEYAVAKDKTFVKALENIEYQKMIPLAIADYWKATKTITRYFSNNISYTFSLNTYRSSLERRMFFAKESVLNEEVFTMRNQELRSSRKLCSDVLGWEASDFESIVANQPFFQNGIVHNIVDDEDFVWDVCDNHES
ncbi:MAG: hypothetical protein RR063_10575 [Anaerovoracaceae bacterium]